MARTDDKYHAELEREVDEYLRSHGFIVPSAVTYHEVWPAEIKNLVASRQSMTALYLRSRADRVAIHADLPIEFEWECKTNQKYFDLSFEALPFMHHLAKARLGVRCLLCIWNLRSGFHHGTWISWEVVDNIREIRVPDKCRMTDKEAFIRCCEELLPQVRVKPTGGTNGGSNDPFVVIDKSLAPAFPHWHDLIDDLFSRDSMQSSASITSPQGLFWDVQP